MIRCAPPAARFPADRRSAAFGTPAGAAPSATANGPATCTRAPTPDSRRHESLPGNSGETLRRQRESPAIPSMQVLGARAARTAFGLGTLQVRILAARKRGFVALAGPARGLRLGQPLPGAARVQPFDLSRFRATQGFCFDMTSQRHVSARVAVTAC